MTNTAMMWYDKHIIVMGEIGMDKQQRAKENVQPKDNPPVSVPYVVYRDVEYHYRWIVRRMVYALIAAMILLFASNLAWLLVWNSYEFSGEETITTIDSEGEGIANYTGGNGGVITNSK